MRKKTHFHSSSSSQASTMNLNLVLVGKTGAGKSASGNTILQRRAFSSSKISCSVTQDVAVEYGTVDEIPVTVYDTPGLFDTEMSDEEIQQKLKNVFQRCESDRCVFLMVIKADRFTKEERVTVEKIEKLLGKERMKKTWILFTGGDELDEENMTIHEFIKGTKALKELVQKYDHRYHVFNNKIKGDNKQVRTLLVKMIQTSFGMKPSDGGRLTRQSPLIRANIHDEPNTPVSSLPARRIVLLGKTGVGKSAAGNTILGEKEFESELNSSSVTRECSDAHATVSGRSVSVVDTPGFFDTKMKPEELMVEIARSFYLSSPGPDAFLIVFKVNDRFTDQDQQISQIIEMLFGQEVLKYSIILFTNGDLLKGKPIEKLIEENSRLRHLVQECGGRFHVFNNKAQNNREQVNDLLQKIDTMIEQNGGGHYSNQMFEDAERFRREEEEQRLREEEVRQREQEERRQREEEQRKQKEEQRREEIERVRNETEERIRAKYEAQIRSEVERLVAQREIEKKQKSKLYKFQQFFSKYKSYFYIVAFAIGGVAGAVAGGVGGFFIGGVVGAISGAIIGGACGIAVVAAAGRLIPGTSVSKDSDNGASSEGGGAGVVNGPAIQS